ASARRQQLATDLAARRAGQPPPPETFRAHIAAGLEPAPASSRQQARDAGGRAQSPVARITSEALITAVTLLPSARPSWRTASTVIDATRRTPLADSSTFAIASPVLMLVTLAGIWLRALSCMTDSTLSDRDGRGSTLSQRRTGPGPTRVVRVSAGRRPVLPAGRARWHPRRRG